MTRLPSCVSKGTLGRCNRWIRCRAKSDTVGLEPWAGALSLVPATAAVAPARGASAVQLNSFLLVKSTICLSLSASLGRVCRPRMQIYVTALRHQDVVALRRHLPDCHHGVVLMHHVVAVDRVFAQPVAEAEEQLHPLVGVELGNVLASEVRRYGRRRPVTAQDLVLFQMNM